MTRHQLQISRPSSYYSDNEYYNHRSSNSTKMNVENTPKYPFARPEHSYDAPAELKKLRDQAPTHRIELFDGTPAWIVTRHKEVCELLASDKFSNVPPTDIGQKIGPEMLGRTGTTRMHTPRSIPGRRKKASSLPLCIWMIRSMRGIGTFPTSPFD